MAVSAESVNGVYENGRLPDSVLAPVPGGRLRRDAAAAFNAMSAESVRRFGVTLRAEGPLGSYRDLAGQEETWALYRTGRGNLAAHPGTSNHGLGLAIDLGSHEMRKIVDEIGAQYGWSKAWSDAPSEWWHLEYRPGVWHGPIPSDSPDRRTRALAMPSAPTAVVQKLLRAHGYRSVPVDGLAGRGTVDALHQFQASHHLPATGRVDRETVAALRAEPANHSVAGNGGGPERPAEPQARPLGPPRRDQTPPMPGGAVVGELTLDGLGTSITLGGHQVLSREPGPLELEIVYHPPGARDPHPQRGDDLATPSAEPARPEHPTAPARLEHRSPLEHPSAPVRPDHPAAPARPPAPPEQQPTTHRAGTPVVLDTTRRHAVHPAHRHAVHLPHRQPHQPARPAHTQSDGRPNVALTQSRFPLNRVIALLGPYIALASGAVAAWLSQHFPGLVTNLSTTTKGITQGATFVVGVLITWALQHKYLDGWQGWEQGLLQLEGAKVARGEDTGYPPARPDEVDASSLGPDTTDADADYDGEETAETARQSNDTDATPPAVQLDDVGALVSDAEEFADPPPGMPVTGAGTS